MLSGAAAENHQRKNQAVKEESDARDQLALWFIDALNRESPTDLADEAFMASIR